MNSLALINLIHSDPLALYSKNLFNISRGTTRDNLSRVISGEVDYSMISLVDYFKNADKLKIVNGPTISGKIHSNSNLLVSKGGDPFPGMRIAVSSETETTAFYLKLILDQLYPGSILIRSKHGNASDLLSEENFALVIGNNALEIYHSNIRILLDITHMISRLFNRYSIYGVTVSLKEREEDIKLEALKNVPVWFINEHIAEIADKHHIQANLLGTYYSALTYDFNEIMLENIHEYKKDYDRVHNSIFSE